MMRSYVFYCNALLIILLLPSLLFSNPYQQCFKNDDSKALIRMIKREFNINKSQIINGERGTLLYHACKHNKEILTTLLRSKNLKVDSKAFILAAKKNNLAILELGIRQGINIDGMIYGETALDGATLYANEEAARLLLEHNATINLKTSFMYAAHNRWIWFLQHAIDQGIKEDANWDGFFEPRALTDRATYNFLQNHGAFEEHDRWCEIVMEWHSGDWNKPDEFPYTSTCKCAPYQCPWYYYDKYDYDFVSSKFAFGFCMMHDDEEYTTRCIQDNKFAVNEPVYPHASQDVPLLYALKGDLDSDKMLVLGLKYPERCFKHMRFNVIRSLLKAGVIVDKKSLQYAVMLNITLVIRAALEQSFDPNSIPDVLSQTINERSKAAVRLLLDADIAITESDLIRAARAGYWWVLEIARSRGFILDRKLYQTIKEEIMPHWRYSQHEREREEKRFQEFQDFFRAQDLPEEVLH